MATRIRLVGLDIESKRKGSDWSSGSYNFRDLICADLRFADEKTHRFLPFDFNAKALDRWAEPLRQPGLLVIAHNGTYDLRGVNATLIGYGLKPLCENLLCDTLKSGPKGDGWIRRDLASMAVRYGIPAKGSINQAEWELAYAGDTAIRAQVEAYCKNDVDVVLALQVAMLARDHLSAPKPWRP